MAMAIAFSSGLQLVYYSCRKIEIAGAFWNDFQVTHILAEHSNIQIYEIYSGLLIVILKNLIFSCFPFEKSVWNLFGVIDYNVEKSPTYFFQLINFYWKIARTSPKMSTK